MEKINIFIATYFFYLIQKNEDFCFVSISHDLEKNVADEIIRVFLSP